MVELLVVLVILAVLAAAIIPSMLGFIDESKRKLCEVNRLQIIRYYQMMKQTHEPLGETVTLQDVFDGKYPEVAPDIPRIKCPSGGTYTVEGEIIVCSVLSHGGNGSSGGEIPDEPSGGGSFLPGTDPDVKIPIVSSYWPKPEEFDDDPAKNVYINAGGIFEYGGSYYVVTRDTTRVSLAHAINGPGSSDEWFVMQITQKVWTKADVTQWEDIAINGNVSRGDIFDSGDGNYYVFDGGGTIGYWPDIYNQWYQLPK